MQAAPSDKGSKLYQAVDFILQHIAVQNPDLKRKVSEHRVAIECEVDAQAAAPVAGSEGATAAAPRPRATRKRAAAAE